jgi:hypothetical protein
MKRKFLLSSAVVPALLASGAMGQVVNFHDCNNGQLSFPGVGYSELFAGQGAYADPGNNIWNGFGQFGSAYQSTAVYSSDASNPSGPWPQPAGNPGNPYAWYNGTSSTGPALFDFATGSATASGNAASSGQWTPITLSIPSNYSSDNGIGNLGSFYVPNGTPQFLLGEAAINNGSTPNIVFVLQNVPPGTYGLYLYGANEGNGRGTAFALDSANGGNPHNGITATLNANNGAPASAFVEGQDFVIFENVSPDSSGDITITASPNPADGVGNSDGSGETDVNGFQLIFNPLPTAVAATAAQNVYAGGTANFSFAPAFAPSPTFQWQSIISGVTNNLSDSAGYISGSATTNLTIAGVSSANVGLYQCRIVTATATNTTPAAPLTLLTSTNVNILQPGDTLSDFGNNAPTSPPYNSVPPTFVTSVADVEDGTLIQYNNFGANGCTTPFAGPVGFIVQPKFGGSVVTAMRVFTAWGHPEDDPADYLLEGSTDGINFKKVSSGPLALPAQRNLAAGNINVNNQVLQEIDFVNTNWYFTYRLTFSNVVNNAAASNGVQLAEVQLLGVSAGSPVILTNLPSQTSQAQVGDPLTFAVAVVGPSPYYYQWYKGGSGLSGATNSIYTLNAVAGTTDYSVVISNVLGSVTSAVAVVVGTVGTPPIVTFNEGTGWTLNGSVATENGLGGNVLTLTDGGQVQSSSAFYDTPQYIGGFLASFTYNPVGSVYPADGMTFCIQNSSESTNATGGIGGELGYYGITPSAAFELNMFGGAVGGAGIQFGTGGSTPDTANPTAPYISTGDISLWTASDDSDTLYVQLYYIRNVLTVWLDDLSTGDSFTTNFAVPNLPLIVGGNTAYVGLTGATGGNTSTQTVSDFQFSSTAPPVLSVAPGAAGSLVISWPLAVSTLFTLQTSGSLSGPWTPVNVTPTVLNGQNQVTVTTGTGSAFYTLLAP